MTCRAQLGDRIGQVLKLLDSMSGILWRDDARRIGQHAVQIEISNGLERMFDGVTEDPEGVSIGQWNCRSCILPRDPIGIVSELNSQVTNRGDPWPPK